VFRRIIKSWFFWLPLIARGLSPVVGRFMQWLQGGRAVSGRVWRRFSHFQQNILIGVLIAVALHLAHNTVWVRDVEDWAMDWMNRLQVDTGLLAAEPGRVGYTFIDMDEAAFAAWDEPYHVPRDRLLQLIRYAAEGGAASIVVDVDLSRGGVVPAADQALQHYLAAYPADAPPLILMRTFAADNPASGGLPGLRHTYFDAAITSPAIHWAQPHFEVDSGDRAIRRWRLVEAGCLNGVATWLPSPQLLTTLLLESAAATWPAVAQRLAAATAADCSGQAMPQAGAAGTLRLAGRDLNLFAGGARQRVIYSVSDRLPLGAEALDYRRLPAGLITGSATPPASDPVQGRVVVIGASYQASHDVHRTPVGDMPGALIILNAIKSLQQFGQLQGPPVWIKAVIEGALILLMAWAFARFSSIGGVLLTGVGVAVVLVPVSFYVFRHGIWVDLAAPILGMQLHQMWAKFEEGLALKNRLKTLQAMADARQANAEVAE